MRRNRALRGALAATVAALAFFHAGALAASTGGPREPASGGRILMGTRCTISAYPDAPTTRAAIDAALDRIADLDLVMTTWRREGELDRVNRIIAAVSEPASQRIALSEDLALALEAAHYWARATAGHFDATLGTGGAHYGVDTADRELHIASEAVRFDLGGIGKGIALDQAAVVLRERGIERALLDFGGQLLALGPPPGEAGWLVALVDPLRDGESLAIVELKRGSISTSNNSERAIERLGAAESHIIDPLAGAPTALGGSITAFAPNATAADALSTALFVAPPDQRESLLPQGTGALLLENAAGTAGELLQLGSFPRLISPAQRGD